MVGRLPRRAAGDPSRGRHGRRRAGRVPRAPDNARLAPITGAYGLRCGMPAPQTTFQAFRRSGFPVSIGIVGSMATSLLWQPTEQWSSHTFPLHLK